MRRHLVPVGVLAAALALATPVAAMEGGSARLSVSPKTVKRGAHYTLRGTGWNTSVHCRRGVTLESSRGTSLGAVTISSSGRFTARRTIKRRAKRGRYAVTATQACEGGPAERTVTLKIV
jgi:hypothetical protein